MYFVEAYLTLYSKILGSSGKQALKVEFFTASLQDLEPRVRITGGWNHRL
jgi:hypothetical protein